MIVNVTIPVFNEEAQLEASTLCLHQFLSERCRFDFEITIANNGSTDRTRQVAEGLCQKLAKVRLHNLTQKGRGRALKAVWNESNADVLSYMDVDLSSDLCAFPPMVEALLSGGFDLATGSRLLQPSLTRRCFKRECISRIYNLMVKALCRTRFSDAQCGFKAITRRTADKLLPMVEDNAWFFDTELLVLAERFGYRIFDLPVKWIEDTDSRVKIVRTAIDDIKGLLRVRQNFAQGAYAGAFTTKEYLAGAR